MEWTALLTQLEAGSPLAIGLVLVGIAWSTRRGVLGSLGRFGARLGRLEQARATDLETARLERARRWQIEAVLIASGCQLPPWPDLTDVIPPPARHALPDWSPQ